MLWLKRKDGVLAGWCCLDEGGHHVHENRHCLVADLVLYPSHCKPRGRQGAAVVPASLKEITQVGASESLTRALHAKDAAQSKIKCASGTSTA